MQTLTSFFLSLTLIFQLSSCLHLFLNKTYEFWVSNVKFNYTFHDFASFFFLNQMTCTECLKPKSVTHRHHFNCISGILFIIVWKRYTVRWLRQELALSYYICCNSITVTSNLVICIEWEDSKSNLLYRGEWVSLGHVCILLKQTKVLQCILPTESFFHDLSSKNHFNEPS